MKKRIYIIILSIVTIIFLINIYYFCLLKKEIFIPCLFHEITGFYCPGCGITRMIISLIELDFYQAFRYNLLVFLFLPIIIFYIIDFIFKWINNKHNYLYKKINDKIWFILLVITLLFGLLRNIPVFDYLIPTVV